MNKQGGHQINPEKLLLSKWTAVKPSKKEKHFLVTRLIRDEQEIVVACLLEAVINSREVEIDWHALKDASIWLPGWL
ncbi:MAG: TIGR02450 family Trp-rich protein [Methylococcaceae bacterium]|jgi:tryptophan-rich hypothetical protein